MKRIWPLIISSILLITGCNTDKKEQEPSKEDSSSIVSPSEEPISSEESTSEESSSEEILPEGQARVEMKGRSQNYSAIFKYDDNYFASPNNVVNIDLAIFSYGLSNASMYKENMMKFYQTLKFEDITLSPSFENDPTEDSVAYGIAHHNDYVLCSIRGFEYKAEWANNFKLGESGDHVGFKNSANQVVEGLYSYFSKINLANPKLLITGYSRAGAIANVAADILLKKNSEEKIVKDDNLYVYTFEAPRALEDGNPYDNVINFINSADPIPYFAPMEYGLYRCGRDIDIYNKDVDSLVKEFDPSIALPAFTPSEEEYDSEDKYALHLIKLLINSEYDFTYKLDTRANYVLNAEGTISYALKMVFSLKQETLDKMVEDISNKGMMELFPLISDGNALKDFLKTYLDMDGHSYNEEELLKECTQIVNLIVDGPLAYILSALLTDKENMSRALYMHFPEVNYVLLNNYSAE